MSLEDLYREVILDHYRNPRNRTELDDPQHRAEGVNPLCGDEVVVELSFDDGIVEAVSVRGQGCSISQSSGSMMSTAVQGRTKKEIAEIAERFRDMFSSDDETDQTDLGDLAALQGVRRYPVRVKCATLPWATLDEALEAGADGAVSIA